MKGEVEWSRVPVGEALEGFWKSEAGEVFRKLVQGVVDVHIKDVLEGDPTDFNPHLVSHQRGFISGLKRVVEEVERAVRAAERKRKLQEQVEQKDRAPVSLLAEIPGQDRQPNLL